MRFRFLGKKIQFPHPETADANGIVAIGGDLRPERLVLAYRQGIFPWYSDGEPILWWSPNPRFVLYPEHLKIRRSLRKIINQKRFEIRYDTAFEKVIRICATMPRPGQEGTWITREMQEAYILLHRSGYAHSVEAWLDGKLAGGLYGLAMGSFFFGESMFYIAPNASKVALAALVERFKDARLIDCQAHNPFFESMGAEHIPRSLFLEELEQHIDDPNLWELTAGNQS
ncbi:MAG: leucyl/phenylalanyl-tRNA--protein transferase [Acidobacteriota bacterium]|nr:leucyl/phenylalanyl-tRNA--protein transferase [Acidobacteriota bacterium]